MGSLFLLPSPRDHDDTGCRGQQGPREVMLSRGSGHQRLSRGELKTFRSRTVALPQPRGPGGLAGSLWHPSGMSTERELPGVPDWMWLEAGGWVVRQDGNPSSARL